MIDTDIAWAAGFLDGEGCFYGTARQPNDYDGWVFQVRLVAQQVEREPIVFLQSVLGGNIKSLRRQKAHWRDKHEWCISRAADISKTLPMLIPHLRGKRHQAELLLELCSTITSDYNSRRRVPVEVVARRLEIVHELKAAKR